MKPCSTLTRMAGIFALAVWPTLHSFGQYTQITIGTVAAGIEKSATTLTDTAFVPAVATAWSSGAGGVLNLSGTVANATTTYHGDYGDSKYLTITSSVAMQNVTANPSSFTPLSAPNATTSTADLADYTLTLALGDNNTGLPPDNEVIKQVGLVILSRNNTQYPLDIRVTATFSDATTEVATANVGKTSGGDDTFFGFTAPDGAAVVSLRLQSFESGTETPKNTRICWDDFGFITGAPSSTPIPVITGVTPENGAVTDAANGIHFSVIAYEAIEASSISLVVNSVDVSGELVISGDAGNYDVAYNGLAADQQHTIEISVANSGGSATAQRTFYTFTTPVVLYDSGGFEDENIFPVEALQNVTDGLGVWEPNADEPATIVDAGGEQGKVLERAGSGAIRADALRFPAVSSGTLTLDFDVLVSITDERTIDLTLQAESGVFWSSFLAWGTIPGKLAYYDNTAWQPLMDWSAGWHHVQVVHYLSGVAAARYDVSVDDQPIGTLIPFRNATPGMVFNRFRIQTHSSTPWFEYGQIDNLVVTVGPETAAILPPTIGAVSPANHTIAPASAGVQFNVQSQVPLAEADIELRLNDTVTSLNFSGAATNLTATHAPLASGNYSLAIQAANAAGTTQWASDFIAANDPWLYAPSPGWTGPWQWSTGMGTLETDAALGGDYLHYDVTTVGVRNLMREYTSSPGLDLNVPHVIRWKFRLLETDFASNFDVFNDRVHFYGRNAARPTGSTDASTSWSIAASGDEQTPGSGVMAGKTFYIFDNTDGTGAFKAGNLVDTAIAIVPEHVYAFAVTIHPADATYTVSIADQTADTSFQSAAPHHYRASGVTGTSHPYLHFGVQASPATDARAFDLGAVEIVPALQPSVTLLDPAYDGTNFSFSFTSQAGMQHVVEYTSDLTATTWTPLETVTGDGTLKTVTHANPPGGQLFYRISSH
ncbi:MAG: hypothetical protein M9920_13510 [Verrucomicrobiae bacterium]|nr:hypothetical protein [Verrucomicrobiae bacterium]